MRAAQIATLDGPSAISVVDVPEPDSDGTVLIDVHVAGVTFPEVLLSRGQYQIKPPLPFVPGSEVAGTVRSAPAGSGLQPGRRVAAFPGFGGFAEVAAVDPGFVFPLPDDPRVPRPEDAGPTQSSELGGAAPAVGPETPEQPETD